MSDQEKNPKETSNIFESIIKLSVAPKTYDAEKCPTCGLMADFVPPAIRVGKIVTVNFKCLAGHQFSKKLNLL